MKEELIRLSAELGWAKTAFYLLSRCVDKWLPGGRLIYYHIVLQPVPDKPLLDPRRGNQFAFRVLDQPDKLLDQLPRPAHVIESRFQQGSVCIAATLGDELVGCTWLQFGAYREDEVRSVFTPSSADIAWDYDVYVRDDQRMGFLFAKMWDQVNSQLRLHRITTSASRISGFNTQSIKSHERLGARRIQSITYVVLGRLQITLSSRRPWLQVSMSEAGAPLIHIHNRGVSLN